MGMVDWPVVSPSLQQKGSILCQVLLFAKMERTSQLADWHISICLSMMWSKNKK
jgi:hypothetical protein